MIKNKILITGSNGDIGKLLTKQFRRSKIIRYKRHNSKTKGDELFKYLEQLFKKKILKLFFIVQLFLKVLRQRYIHVIMNFQKYYLISQKYIRLNISLI